MFKDNLLEEVATDGKVLIKIAVEHEFLFSYCMH